VPNSYLLCHRPRRRGGIINCPRLSLCLSVRLSVACHRHNSRTKRPRKPKIGRMEAHHTGIQWTWTYLEVKRSKVKMTRPNNHIAHTVNVQYLPSRKAYTNVKFGTQTQHVDPHQQQAPWPSRSEVKVTRSRDASDRCWTISRERNVLRKTKIGRNIVHPTIEQ